MTIRLFWFRGANHVNFGDELSGRIVEMLSGRAVEYAPVGACNFAAIGSILDQVLPTYVRTKRTDPLQIWGAGNMSPRTYNVLPAGVQVHAVRGPLTRAGLPGDDATTLGDPGLLAGQLFDGLRVDKAFTVGIIPHKSERNRPEFRDLARQLPGSRLINVMEPDPTDVARAMKACHFILSSSLHGLIVADAFGIPNAWLNVTRIHTAPEFKFFDYFISTGRPIRAHAANAIAANFGEHLFDLAAPARVAEMAEALRASFPRYIG